MRASWAMVVVVLTVAVTVLSVLIATGWPPLAGLDADVALGLAAVMPAHPVVVTVMIVVTDVGSPVGVNLLTGAAVVVLLLRRRVRVAAYLVAVRLCVLVVETALKHGLAPARPPVPALTSASGFSFPSGHAGGTAALCVSALFVLLPVVHRRWRAGAVAAAVLLSVVVAASRVVLGVHYPSDRRRRVSWWVRCAASPSTAPPRARRPGDVDHENDVRSRPARAHRPPRWPQFHRSIVAMSNPAEGRDASWSPALCAVPGVGPETDAPHGSRTSVRCCADAPLGQPGPEGGPTEDLVPCPRPALRLALWYRPPGRGTHERGSGAAAVVRVRTTVLNESAAPYDVWAVLGPTAGMTGATSRGSPTRASPSRLPEHIVQPGRAWLTRRRFPAGPGRLTLQYRADFRFEAVVVDDPGFSRPVLSSPAVREEVWGARTSRPRRSTGRPAARAVPGGGDGRGGDGVPGRAGVGLGVRARRATA